MLRAAINMDCMHLTSALGRVPQHCPEFRAELKFGSARLSFSYHKLVLILPFARVSMLSVQKLSTKGLCGAEAVSTRWLLSRKACGQPVELLFILLVSMMQASPHAQGQKKGLKPSDTKVTSL